MIHLAFVVLRGRSAMEVTSVVSFGDFQQVVSELCLYRSLDDTNISIEDSLVEFWNHLSG